MQELRVNIGAGKTFIPGFVNVDANPWADVVLDLGRDRLPFDDDTVDLVFSYFCLEHVPDYLFALGEIHRVLKHGGRLLVGLPYVTSTTYHLVNPYHLHNFNEYSFDFFEKDGLKDSAAESNQILFKKAFHTYHHYIGIFKVVPEPLRSWCRKHLFNVVKYIDFGLFAVKAPHTTFTLTAGDKKRLMSELRQCKRARRPYDAERKQRALAKRRPANESGPKGMSRSLSE